MQDNFFSQYDMRKATKQTLLEKFCLFFINKKYNIDDIEGITTVYKIYKGKLYILDSWLNPPTGYSCRHDIDLRPNKDYAQGGYTSCNPELMVDLNDKREWTPSPRILRNK